MPRKLPSLYPLSLKWPFYLIFSIVVSVTILGTWLFHSGKFVPALSDVDNNHSGELDDSDAFWYSGKFVNHNLGKIPQFDAHHSPVDDIPVDKLGYSAAVVYLISDNRLREVILSLSYLYRNVPMQPWPIVLFYANDMDDPKARQEFILQLYDFIGEQRASQQFIERIEFVRLEWTLPPGFSYDKEVVKPVFEYAWPGYHMMCAFYATQIFDHPRLANVTYYMRLDTDSYIFKPICYDPVDLLHTRNRTYGYRSRTTDPPFVIEGLWDLTDEYANHHPEVEDRMKQNGWKWPKEREQGKMNEYDYPTYYNNFEIVKLDAFRRPAVRNWLDEIMKNPERIYKYRWGDAPIRFSTVNMFFDVKNDVEEYCSIPYWHNGHQGNLCSCEDQKAGRT